MNPVQESSPTTRQPMRSAVLVGIVAVTALLGIAHGVLIAVGAAQRTATWIVTVPVRPTLAFPADLPITGLVLAETPDMTRMPTAFDGGLVMFLERSDPLTAVPAGADSWITWLAVGAIVLMLLPVLRSGRSQASWHTCRPSGSRRDSNRSGGRSASLLPWSFWRSASDWDRGWQLRPRGWCDRAPR